MPCLVTWFPPVVHLIQNNEALPASREVVVCRPRGWDFVVQHHLGVGAGSANVVDADGFFLQLENNFIHILE